MKLPLSFGAVARQVYALALAQGRGQQDWTAVYAMIRDMARLPAKG